MNPHHASCANLRHYKDLLKALGAHITPTFTRSAPIQTEHNPLTVVKSTNIIKEGNRNSQLTSIAGSMRRRGAIEDEMLQTLRELNATQVSPPLDDAEVRRIVASVSRYSPAPSASISDPFNDTANAQRLVDLYGLQLRYVVEDHTWLIWNDERWRKDTEGSIVEIAKLTGRSIYEEAARTSNKELGEGLAKHARASLNMPRIKAMIELAKTNQSVVTHASELDQKHDVLGVKNGVVVLGNGRLRPSDQNDLISRHAPIVFDPNAKCPTWHRFLNRVTNYRKRGGDRRKLLKYLQRVVGYTLSGFTEENVLFFLYGSGANGKTTFIKVLEALLGSELSCTLPYESLVSKKDGRGPSNDIARTRSMRAVFTNEVEDGTFLAESLIKQLTGSDTFTARFLYREYVDFTPRFKLFIAGNHRPVIKGDDDGIWRRLHLVPFNVFIPESERDPRLMEKLCAELPGILNWALRGYQDWRRRGLCPPKCVTDAGQEYREDMDLIGQWLESACALGDHLTLTATRAYEEYRDWAIRSGHKPMSGAKFGRKLRERFKRKKTSQGNIYIGLTVAAVSAVGVGVNPPFS